MKKNLTLMYIMNPQTANHLALLH